MCNIKYQICTKCVMDTTDPAIYFDGKGICNHCYEYAERKKKLISDPFERERELKNIIEKIKSSGKGKKYDCIVGVSGGLDSSYVAYLAKKWGLKVLLVHFDNGWNSDLAVKNLKNIVKYTGFDLYTLLIDWEEFKDLQISFLKAGVIDLELVSDHAIFATVYKLARKYRVSYLLSGENFATEAILPKSWVWRKTDSVNIKSIHKIYGKKKLNTFPFMGTVKKIIYQYGKLAQSIPILNFLEYNKENAISVLKSEMGWEYYGGKHYESIFTRFYQGYLLPKKFGVDKRRAHYSTLINSGQMTRGEALEYLTEDVYPLELQKKDFDTVCKKLGFTHEEMNDYIKKPSIDHLKYDSDEMIFNYLRKIYLKLNLKKYNKYA